MLADAIKKLQLNRSSDYLLANHRAVNVEFVDVGQSHLDGDHDEVDKALLQKANTAVVLL